MSWWETGNENDVIGDVPVDIIEEILKKQAEQRSRADRPKPTLQELLDSFMWVLKKNPDLFELQTGGKQVQRICATLANTPCEIISNDGTSPDEEFVVALASAFEQVGAKYVDRWSRRPRISELTECLVFILGYKPDMYLSGVENMDVENICPYYD